MGDALVDAYHEGLGGMPASTHAAAAAVARTQTGTRFGPDAAAVCSELPATLSAVLEPRQSIGGAVQTVSSCSGTHSEKGFSRRRALG